MKTRFDYSTTTSSSFDFRKNWKTKCWTHSKFSKSSTFFIVWSCSFSWKFILFFTLIFFATTQMIFCSIKSSIFQNRWKQKMTTSDWLTIFWTFVVDTIVFNTKSNDMISKKTTIDTIRIAMSFLMLRKWLTIFMLVIFTKSTRKASWRYARRESLCK